MFDFSEILDTCKVQLPKDCFEKIESLVQSLCLANDKELSSKVKYKQKKRR